MTALSDLARAVEDAAAELTRLATILREQIGPRVDQLEAEQYPGPALCQVCDQPESDIMHAGPTNGHRYAPPPAQEAPPRAASEPQADAQAVTMSAPGSGCECTLWARCDFHEANKPKGCTCNGPYFSASCGVEKHAAAGRAWPAGDPAAVG